MAELKTIIRELKRILASEERQLEVVLDELAEVVKQYGDERRTVILAEEATVEEPEVEEEEADEDVVITVSHEGFVKRMPMHLYRRRLSSGKALAEMDKYEEDYIERMFVARTQGWILAFTRGGSAHFLAVTDVPESGRASRGQSAYSLLAGADRKDPIVAMIPVPDLSDEEKVLVFLTRSGVIKRTPLAEFANPRSGGIIAAGLKQGDEVLDVAISDGQADVILLTGAGRAIRFPEEQVSVVGRTAQGVRGIDLRDDDAAVGLLLIRRDASVLTVTEDGLAKRTPVGEFPLQKRGGLGTMALPAGGKGSRVVAALEVLPEDEVMVVSAGGRVTRVRVRDVPEQGKRTQGRRVVKVEAGDRVAQVTRAAGSGRGEEGDGDAIELDEEVEVEAPAKQLDLLGGNGRSTGGRGKKSRR
jgi:DNA gyrase subunit A